MAINYKFLTKAERHKMSADALGTLIEARMHKTGEAYNQAATAVYTDYPKLVAVWQNTKGDEYGN